MFITHITDRKMGKSEYTSIDIIPDELLIEELTRRGYSVFEPMILMDDDELLPELEPITFDNNWIL